MARTMHPSPSSFDPALEILPSNSLPASSMKLTFASLTTITSDETRLRSLSQQRWSSSTQGPASRPSTSSRTRFCDSSSLTEIFSINVYSQAWLTQHPNVINAFSSPLIWGLSQGDNSFVINKESGFGNARRDCYVPESRHVVGISARDRQYRRSVTPEPIKSHDETLRCRPILESSAQIQHALRWMVQTMKSTENPESFAPYRESFLV